MEVDTKLFFCFAFFLSLQVGIYSAVRIHIVPSEYSAIVIADKIRISCLPECHGNQTKDIILMQVAREGEEPIASLHPGGVSPPQTLSNNIKMQGHINNEAALSYLNITLMSPTDEVSGTYTCSVYYLDESKKLKEETASEKLIIKKSDISTLEHIIRKLNNKMILLEEKAFVIESDVRETKYNLKGEITGLKGRVTGLKDVTGLKGEMNGLKGEISGLKGNVIRLDERGSTVLDRITKVEKITDGQSKDLEDLFDQAFVNENDLVKTKQKLNGEITRLDERTFTIENDVKETKQRLKGEITRFDQIAATITEKVARLEAASDEQSTDLDDLKDKVSVIGNDLQKTKKDLKGDISRMEMQDRLVERPMQTIVGKQSAKTVSFYVGLTPPKVLKDGRNPICGFTKHYIDNGRGYFDENDCTFTTPVDGTYWLGGYMQQVGEGELYMYISFGVGGLDRFVMSHEPTTFVSGSTIRHIVADSKVRLEVKRARGVAQVVDCYFYGFLV